MKIFKIDYNKPDLSLIRQVACAIDKSKIAVVPGDAVYTIVCDAFRKKAVDKILRIKKRDRQKPFNLGLYCLEDIATYGQFNPLFIDIVKKFPKEPFTFVVARKDNIPNFLNPGCSTIGFRIPFNKVTSSLSKAHRTPIIGTSANITELKNTYSVEEFMKYFQSVLGREFEPDIVLDAGKLPGRRPSTVIELLPERVRVIREGEIPGSFLQRQIQKMIKDLNKKHEDTGS